MSELLADKVWEEIEHDDRPHHLDLIDGRLKSLKNTDFQVIIGDSKFDCHRLLLQCFSEVFDELGNIPDVILPEVKVTPDAFQFIYQWLQSPSPRVQRKYFVEVFVAAEYLRIPALINQCWACVDDMDALMEDRAFQVYVEAKPFQHTILQDMMLKRISRYFLPLVATGKLMQLPLEDLVTLLKSNYIGVFSEAEVLYSGLLWLLDDWEQRCEFVDEVMELVRFPLMSRSLLSILINGDEDERINCILQHETTKNLAIQALTNLCMTNSEAKIACAKRSVQEMIKPVKRSWLFDEGAGIQEDETADLMPHRQECTFAEFLEKLQRIVDNPDCWVDWQRVDESMIGYKEKVVKGF